MSLWTLWYRRWYRMCFPGEARYVIWSSFFFSETGSYAIDAHAFTTISDWSCNDLCCSCREHDVKEPDKGGTGRFFATITKKLQQVEVQYFCEADTRTAVALRYTPMVPEFGR